MTVDPYKRVSWRGVTVNQRTKEMLEITELRGLRDLTPLRIVQGSYNPGGVGASGGTHDGGGALDVGILGLTATQRDRIVRELRETSFAAWYRPPIPGKWSAHIHAIAIGDKEMSSTAAQQVVWYRQNLLGLWPAGGGPDNGPNVPITVYRQDIDMSYQGPEHWDEADFDRFRRKVGWLEDVNNFNTDPPTTIDAKVSLAYAHQHATDADEKATLALAAAKSADTKLNALGDKVDQILEAVAVSPPV